MPWVINESTLSPTYIDGPRNSVKSFIVVDKTTGQRMWAENVILLDSYYLPEGDEELSPAELIETAERVGIPLDDDAVN